MGAKQSAVVIIDMQEDVLRGRWFTLSPSPEQIISSCAELVAAARQRGIPVLYTKVEYRPDGSNTPVAVATGEPTPFEFLNEGTPGVAIVPELEPGPDEVVVTKNLISAFDAEGFAEALEARGVDRLVLAGVQLEYALVRTATDARARDLDVIVVSDCSGAANDAAYKEHLETNLPPVAEIVTLAEAVSRISEQTS